jgi:MFS family permease
LAFPQFWMTDTTQLAVIRFFMGVVSGGVVPALRSVLGEEADRDPLAGENMGSIYGLHQSAYTGGFALGSVFAAVIGSAAGLPMTEIATGVIMVGTATWWFLTASSRPAVRKRPQVAD